MLFGFTAFGLCGVELTKELELGTAEHSETLGQTLNLKELKVEPRLVVSAPRKPSPGPVFLGSFRMWG